MKIKITAPNGKYSIITTRDEETTFDCKINHVSSTEEQPYIAVNFDENGVAVGGRTLQESAMRNILKVSAEKDFIMEEL